MERDLEYDALVESVARRVVPEMEALLEDIKIGLREHDYKTTKTIDLTDSNYRFDFGATRPDGLDFCVSIEMIEQRVDEEEGYGVTFMLSITKQDGLLVADISPYNFTPQIWRPDLRDIQTVMGRWYLLTDAVMESDIPSLLDEEEVVVERRNNVRGT